MSIPIVIGPSGAQPQSPASLRAQLIALATAEAPGLTTELPGSLIEDIISTDVAGVALADAAWIELLNSLTPSGANAFILNQLGQMLGVELGQNTNTAVYVVFQSNTPGFIIGPGFNVSDGTYQYTIQDGGVIATDGSSDPLFCLATQAGAWAVAANSVTQLASSIPAGITLTCTNPLAGTPSPGAQTEEGYRADVLRANRAASMGMTSYMKTLLRNVTGVQSRLVSVAQIDGGGWEVIVGGTGDPYQIAYAIYAADFAIDGLVGSTINVTGYTKANPGVISTDLNHGLVNGQLATISGANPGTYNHTGSVTVIDEKTFTVPLNTTGFATYVGGGVVTPNSRNQAISITDYPDVYTVPFVVPPQQNVIIALTWNTTATNLIANSSVQQLGAIGLANYVNSIAAGQPMNLFELQNAFQVAVASIVPTALLTRMVFVVQIDGVVVVPSSGTGIIAGDPESYLSIGTINITITRG